MYLTIQKWGNSLALRIPQTVAKQAKVHQGSRMGVSLTSNKIILSQLDVQEYSLNNLVRRINKNNIHKEAAWGLPQGKEVW